MKTTFFAATFLVMGCGGAVDGGFVSHGGAAGTDAFAGATSDSGAGGASGSTSSGCGPDVSDEACRRLSACGTHPVGAASGERINYVFADLVTYTDEEMLARCRSYCEESGRCGATDEGACAESCPEVVEQARKRTCQSSLLDALECMEKEVCTSGFPTPEADNYGDHPCGFRTRLVDCTILPERGAPEAFAYFGAGGGTQYVAGTGGGFDENSCLLSLSTHLDTYRADVLCNESSGGLCCTCNGGGRPVRRVSMLTQKTCTADSNYDPFFEACGWRFWSP